MYLHTFSKPDTNWPHKIVKKFNLKVRLVVRYFFLIKRIFYCISIFKPETSSRLQWSIIVLTFQRYLFHYITMVKYHFE